MTKIRIQFGKRYDHFIGNGTTEHYAPGDFGTFDEKLANSLVYEGYAVAVPDDQPEAEAPEQSDGEQKSEGDSPEDKAVTAAPENKKKKR